MQFSGVCLQHSLSSTDGISRHLPHTHQAGESPSGSGWYPRRLRSSCDVWSTTSRISDGSLSQTCITNSLSPSVDICSTCDWKYKHTCNNFNLWYTSDFIMIFFFFTYFYKNCVNTFNCVNLSSLRCRIASCLVGPACLPLPLSPFRPRDRLPLPLPLPLPLLDL